MFIGGIFQPKLTILMQGIVLIGRELYRFGYMSKQGPNSKIRELGAIPLNAAEIILLISFTSIYFRHRFAGALKNRKIVKRFTHSKQDIMFSKVLDEEEKARQGLYKIYRDQRSLLPMHPSFFGKKGLPTERGLPGEISPNRRLPDIPSSS